MCLRLASEHYENFPVASRLLPAEMRRPIAAVYAFARHADDFADEGEYSDAERLSRLEGWRARLYQAGSQVMPDTKDNHDLIFLAVADTLRSHDLPVELFDDLISAFEQDVVVHRYDVWPDLLDYCRRSANPVGRLVLRIAGYRNVALDRASDSVCTALQLTNFLQDFDGDLKRGRLYVPADVCAECGADEAALGGPSLSAEWRAALRVIVGRTRRLFDEGRRVCDGVDGRLGFEIRLTWLGGRRILDRLESCGYDPRERRPTLGTRDALAVFWEAVRWSSTARGTQP